MAKYTVEDITTGKRVTFQWDAPTPPTDQDMEEVFAEARGFETPAAPVVEPYQAPIPAMSQPPYATMAAAEQQLDRATRPAQQPPQPPAPPPNYVERTPPSQTMEMSPFTVLPMSDQEMQSVPDEKLGEWGGVLKNRIAQGILPQPGLGGVAQEIMLSGPAVAKEAARQVGGWTMRSMAGAKAKEAKRLQLEADRDPEFELRSERGKTIIEKEKIDPKKIPHNEAYPVISPEMSADLIKKGYTQGDIEAVWTHLHDLRLRERRESGVKWAESAKADIKSVEKMDPTWYKAMRIGERIDELKARKNEYGAALDRGDLGFVIEQAIGDYALAGEHEKAAQMVALRQQYQDAVQSTDAREKNGWLKNVVLGTLEMLPPMAQGMVKGTVPVVGQAWSMSDWARQGTGQVYGDLVDEGVSPQIAGELAPIAGVLYAAIENLQVTQIARNPVAKDAVRQSVAKTILKVLKEKGIDALKEMNEEGLQRITTDVFTELGKQEAGLSNKTDREVLQDLIKGYREETIGAAPQMTLLNLIGAARGTASAIADRRREVSEYGQRQGQAPAVLTAPQPAQEQTPAPTPQPAPAQLAAEVSMPAKKSLAELVSQPAPSRTMVEARQAAMEDTPASDAAMTPDDFAKLNPTPEQQRAYENMHRTAFTDPLTGLPNRRGIEYRAHKNGTPIDQSLAVMLDIDHFKKVNDTYGHKVGDAVLQEFGELLQERLAGIGTIGRYGGEEFLFLPLTGAPESDILKVVDRTREEFRGRMFADGKLTGLTFSAGMGLGSENADNNLYKAKQNGRSQTWYKGGRYGDEAGTSVQDDVRGADVSDTGVRGPDTENAAGVEAKPPEESAAPTGPVTPPSPQPDKQPTSGAAPPAKKSRVSKSQRMQSLTIAGQKDNIDTRPSEKSKTSGEYKKGNYTVLGIPVQIENPANSARSGKDKDGRAWSVTMQDHYGDIPGTKGKDKDHLDVFINPEGAEALSREADDSKAFVVNQNNPKTGAFDEHKIMVGYADENAAREAYLRNYEPGWQGLGSITEMTLPQLQEWMKKGDMKKPAAVVEEKLAETKTKPVNHRQRLVEAIRRDPAYGAVIGDVKNGEMDKANLTLSRIVKSKAAEVHADGVRSGIGDVTEWYRAFLRDKQDAAVVEEVLKGIEKENRTKPESTPDTEKSAPDTEKPKYDAAQALVETDKTTRIPVDQLIAGDKPSPEKLKKSTEFMLAAIKKEGQRRGAIDVEKTPDGKYRVLDGNATVASLRELGITEAIARVHDFSRVSEEEKEEVRAVYEKAAKDVQPQLDTMGRLIANRVGGRWVTGKAKKPLSILNKVHRKRAIRPDYGVYTLKDLVRGSIVVKNDADLARVVRDMAADGFTFECDISKKTSFGYRPMHGTIDMGDRYTGEVIVLTEELLEIKTESHKVYSKYRNEGLSDEQVSQIPEVKKFNDLYDEYFGRMPREILDEISSFDISTKSSDHSLTVGENEEASTQEPSRATQNEPSESTAKNESVSMSRKNFSNAIPTPSINIPLSTDKSNKKELTDEEKAARKKQAYPEFLKLVDAAAAAGNISPAQVARRVFDRKKAQQDIEESKGKAGAARENIKKLLNDLGDSLSNTDPTRLNSIGTRQMEIAFEAVSQLVDLGYNTFKAVALQVADLARKYLDNPAFRMAIELAYDAYVKVDQDIEARGDLTFASAVGLTEVEESGILEEGDVTPKEDSDELERSSPPTLEGTSTEDVPGPGGEGPAGSGTGEGGRPSGRGNRRARGKRPTTSRSTRNRPAPVYSSSTGESAAGSGEPGIPPGVTRNFGRTDDRGDYHITDADNLGAGGLKTKFKDNVRAIQILKQIESEGRKATPEEQEILVRYVGWGAMSQAFDPKHPDAWAKEYAEIQELLTPAEFEAAAESTINAHYTSPVVIRGMWAALRRMGLTGGPVFEPGCGLGHFWGLRPADLGMNYTGIEMDDLTARIAQQLYQSSNIRHLPFEQFLLTKGAYNAAIGNVPFSGEIRPFDKESKRYGMIPRGYTLHNFFFLKTLYGVKPKGVVAFVTSRFTMDAEAEHIRKEIAARADFIGAIRLPASAFKQNAGTDVVTDIIFLQVREPGAAPSELTKEFLDTQRVTFDLVKEGPGTKEEPVNRYFATHPEMVLGKQDLSGTMYAGNQYNVVLDAKDLPAALQEAVNRLPVDIMSQAESGTTAVENNLAKAMAPDNIVAGAFYSHEGAVYQKQEDGSAQKLDLPEKQLARVEAMIPIKTALKSLLARQMETDDDSQLASHFKAVNRAYDKFVNKYGALHLKDNVAAFEDDIEAHLVLSIENWDRLEKKANKADIFTKRTMPKQKAVVTSAGSASEAMLISLAERAILDWDWMSQLTGKDIDTLQKELLEAGLVFLNPETYLTQKTEEYVQRDDYLSGNVRYKLQKAQEAAAKDERFNRNVEAVKAVVPADLAYADIAVNINTPVLEDTDVLKFMHETFKFPYYNKVRLQHQRVMGKWYIDEKRDSHVKSNRESRDAVYVEYGTDRLNGLEILEALLNNRTIEVKDNEGTVDQPKWVINRDETDKAMSKADAIKKAFQDWIWQDSERAQRIARTYNDLYNATVNRTYTHPQRVMSPNDPVRLPGCTFDLRPHVADAIWRVTQSENTMLAHCVGAGKTLEIIASCMERRRLGLSRKPMVVVPNHLVEQWAAEWRRAYPGAKILVATEKNFSAGDRKEFLNRIVTGDWDGIIIKYSHYLAIPVSPEVEIAYQNNKKAVYEEALGAAEKMNKTTKDGREHRSVKELKARIKNYQARIEQLQSAKRDRGVFYFDDLGVDMISVDEADTFKNVDFFTQRRVLGLGTQAGTQKTTDMMMKIDLVRRRRGAVVFATGTPISNSMAETYHMMRYLQPEILDNLRISNFDEWANNFAESVVAWELNNSGSGYKMRERFSKFRNVPELMAFLRQVWDIRTADMLERDGILVRGKNLPKPTFKTISAPPTKYIKSFIRYLSNLEKDAKDLPGGVLTIIGRGRKASVDMRLIKPDLEDLPDYKLNMVAAKAAELWKRDKDEALTGLIFYDLTRPHPNMAFSPHEELKKKLIAHGVKENEIAFIHDYDGSDAKKLQLFDMVNTGRIRILIGSTEKMGAGTNVQKKLKWMIHIDAPWRPRDIEQREGRIIRQGNSNKEVELYRYVTKGSYDVAMWSLLDIKARVISQVMSGEDTTTREIEDDSAFSSVMLMAVDNPKVKVSMELDAEVKKLKADRSNWLRALQTKENDLFLTRVLSKKLVDEYNVLKDAKEAAQKVKDNPTIDIRGKVYTDKVEAAKVMLAKAEEYRNDIEQEAAKEGGTYHNTYSFRYGDFKVTYTVYVKKFDGTAETNENRVETVLGSTQFRVFLGDKEFNSIQANRTPETFFKALDSYLWNPADDRGIEYRYASMARHYEKRRKELDEIGEWVQQNKTWPREAEARAKVAELDTVLKELREENEKRAKQVTKEDEVGIDWGNLESRLSFTVDEDGEVDDATPNGPGNPVKREKSVAPVLLKEGEELELADPGAYYALRKNVQTKEVYFELIENAKKVTFERGMTDDLNDFFVYKGGDGEYHVIEARTGTGFSISDKVRRIALELAEQSLLDNADRLSRLLKENMQQRGYSPRYRVKGQPAEEQSEPLSAREDPMRRTGDSLRIPQGALRIIQKNMDRVRAVFPEAVGRNLKLHVGKGIEYGAQSRPFGAGERGAYWFDPVTRQAHIYINSGIPVDRIADTLVHEVLGHFGALSVMRANPALYAKLQYLFKLDAGTPRMQRLREMYGDETPDRFFYEWVADCMEDHIRHQRDPQTIVARVVMAIRQWLVSIGIVPQSVDDVMRAMVREMRAAVTIEERQPLLSREKVTEVAELEAMVRRLRGKLMHLSDDALLERADIELKIQKYREEEREKIINTIYAYSRRIGLDGMPRNKVDTLLKNVRGAKGLQAAMQTMDEVMELRRTDELRQKLLETVEREYRRLRAIKGKTASTVDLEANRRLEKYLDELSQVPDADRENMERVLAWFQQYGKRDIRQSEEWNKLPQEYKDWLEDPNQPVPENLKKGIRGLFEQNIHMLMPGKIQQILEEIREIKELGRLRREIELDRRQLQMDVAAENIAVEIEAATAKDQESNLEKAAAARKEDHWKQALSLMQRGFWSLIDPERITESLVNWNRTSNIKDAIVQPIYDAEAQKLRNTKRVLDRFREIHSSINMIEATNKPYMHLNMVIEESDGTSTYKEIPLTLDQMMFIYANNQNPGNQAHLLGTGLTADMIDEVISQLPDEYRAAVDAMIDYYDQEQYPRINEAFIREHQIDMPHEARYFPIQNLKTDRAESSVVTDLLARYSARMGALQKGMTKSRVRSQAPFKQMSYFNTVVRNLTQVEHYVAYQQPVRDVAQVLNHPSVKAAMINKSEERYVQLKNWLKAVAYGKVGGSEHPFDKMADFLRQRYASYVLGLKLVTVLLQTTSYFKGMGAAGKGAVLRATVDFARNPMQAMKFADEKSAFMAARAENYERELAEWAESSAGRKAIGALNLGEKVKEVAMAAIGATDKAVATMLWNGRYAEIMRKTGSEPLAIRLSDELIRKTQSRGGVVMMPSIFRGPGIARAYTMFTSDLNQNVNLLFEMAGTWAQKSTKQKASEIFFYFVLPGTVAYIVSNAFRLPWDEPEEYAKSLISQFTGGLPFFGEFIEAAIGYGMDEVQEARGIKPDTYWRNYIGDLIPTSFQGPATAIEGVARGRPDMLLDAVAQLAGVPYNAIKRGQRGFKKTVDTGDIRYLFWSESAVDPQTVSDAMANRLLSGKDRVDLQTWYRSLDDEQRQKFQREVRVQQIDRQIAKIDRQRREKKITREHWAESRRRLRALRRNVKEGGGQ